MEDDDVIRSVARQELERRLAQSKRLHSENLDSTTRARLAALTLEIEGLISRSHIDDLTRRRDVAAERVDANVDPDATGRLAEALRDLEALSEAAKSN